MNSRSMTVLEQNLAEQAVFDFPGAGVVTGSRKITVFLKALLRKYPRLVFTVDDVLCDRDRACVVWHNEGISSTGEDYANRGITLVHHADGKIMLISDYFKDTAFALKKE